MVVGLGEIPSSLLRHRGAGLREHSEPRQSTNCTLDQPVDHWLQKLSPSVDAQWNRNDATVAKKPRRSSLNPSHGTKCLPVLMESGSTSDALRVLGVLSVLAVRLCHSVRIAESWNLCRHRPATPTCQVTTVAGHCGALRPSHRDRDRDRLQPPSRKRQRVRVRVRVRVRPMVGPAPPYVSDQRFRELRRAPTDCSESWQPAGCRHSRHSTR